VISQTVEYALRAVCYLASQSPAPQTTAQIATATLVPAAYLSKVVQNLNRAGVVRSQRGVGGGVSLVKTPDQLTLLEVVNAVEPIQRIHACPLGLASHGVRLCPLHRRLDSALKTMEEAFRSTTLAEMLSEPGQSTPLCDVPPTDGSPIPEVN
jgi:Rrf2 family nitric oxide-sensitive transcriptional repressor